MLPGLEQAQQGDRDGGLAAGHQQRFCTALQERDFLLDGFGCWVCDPGVRVAVAVLEQVGCLVEVLENKAGGEIDRSCSRCHAGARSVPRVKLQRCEAALLVALLCSDKWGQRHPVPLSCRPMLW